MASPFKLVLVPVDGSEGAARAAEFGAALARATGSPLRLLHVYSPTSTEIVGMAQLSKDQIQQIGRDSAASAFRSAREGIGMTDLVIDEVVAWGDPRLEIVSAAKAADALIVMGRRGLGKMQELLIGSVSDAVVRGAGRPVTLVG